MRKTENFRPSGNLGFCLLVAQPPYPLKRIFNAGYAPAALIF
jgi:hypothetical protein